MPFGQVVVGPPGSGKTTYCLGMKEFLTSLGRKVAVVNLDPANENLPYEADVDINELINLEEVMSRLKLGPNGALIYCMEFLEQNVSWLIGRLSELEERYIFFDFPGQVELYTHHSAVSCVLEQLQKQEFQLVAVNLVDAHYCTDPGNFISVVLSALNTMLQLALPHINVLSKIDLIEKMGKLAFGLEYYTEVMDLAYLLDHLRNDPFMRRFRDLNEKLIDLIENQSLVTFATLDIQDSDSIGALVKLVDKAGGYVFGQGEAGNIEMMQSAMAADVTYVQTADASEKHTTGGRATSPLTEQDVLEAMQG